MKSLLIRAAFSLPVLLAATALRADDLRPPARPPATWQAECGACHVAFPPALLGATDWQRVMAALDKHYGDNATLEPAARQEIEAFLVREAGRVPKHSGGGTAPAELPRLTTTPWFVREHREVPAVLWQHAQVKSPANCAACHTHAAAGSYREREIVMPGARRNKAH